MSEFFENGFKMVPLASWLSWVSKDNPQDENGNEIFIALPMIQRGSVWKPLQIINLWDSLLRGMPLGSLMLSYMKPFGGDNQPVLVRMVGKKDPEKLPSTGGWGLLDGQQRTLAMLTGWPSKEEIDKTIWIDFADKPGDENLFRFHVTTTNQKYGFQREKPNSKLSLSERYRAAYANTKLCNQMQEPWDSYLPIKISLLVSNRDNLKEIVLRILNDRKILLINALDKFSDSTPTEEAVKSHFNKIIKRLEDEYVNILKKVDRFSKALNFLFNNGKIPLLEIKDSFFGVTDNESDVEPPLAILFKRIGAGGTALSDADYVYSVIKHKLPEAYGLIENIAGTESIVQHLTATNVVMTAVRLVAADLNATDHESPTKKEFHLLLKNTSYNFEDAFCAYIENDSNFIKAINNLTNTLRYTGDGDIGFPMHAWILINRPLIQVILLWVLKYCIDKQEEILRKNRLELIRFVLYWVLCVTDQKKASTIIFKYICGEGSGDSDIFHGGKFSQILQKEGVAIPLVTPNTFEDADTRSIVISPESVKGLRGWKRFEVQAFSDTERRDHYQRCIDLYSRWWSLKGGHIHPLLLWLQRALVSEFEGSISPDSEEDTPYDFDHICPSNHWHGWTGITKDRLCDFKNDDNDNQGYWRLGNSIGNIRVLNSSINRSYGDARPNQKLHLDRCSPPGDINKFQNDIDETEYDDWNKCSGDENYKYWDKERALAFQRAIELRAFNLYKKFYADLCFSSDYEWSQK